MSIKSYTTLAGARRATHRNPVPILRILVDGLEDIFIPVTMNTVVMAVDRQTGKADGTIKVLDLATQEER